MAEETIAGLQAKLNIATETLRLADERATAGQLALEMMHEVRNSLDALGNLAYLAREHAADSERVLQYMQLSEEQLAMLSEIVNQTLGLAKPSDLPRPASLPGLAEAALRIHSRAIEAKKVHLVKKLPEDLVAEVHTGEILQVISNVIVNALDALPVDGTLCLRVRKAQGAVHFVIADNGHGIPKENMERVFQPFFTTKNDRGTGLGLSLSKRIVDRLRGKIRVRSSVKEGKSGTTFRISIPV